MKLAATIFFTILNLSIINAQAKYESYLSSEQINSSVRKSLMFGENEISVEIYNYGGIAPGYGLLRGTNNFVWKALSYLYQISPIVGASVPDASNPSNRLHIISDGLWDYPNQIEGNLDGTALWQWQPIEGYSDEGSDLIASNPAPDNDGDGKPDSWPESWYNSSASTYEWPKFLPDNIPPPAIEAYWKMDDRENAEFNYFPFLNDQLKRGIGIEIEARAFQWDHFALENSLLFVYKIKNVSDKNIDTLFFGIYSDADIGGGSPENTDDLVNYFSPTDFSIPENARGSIYFWDNDGTAVGRPTGYMGMKFFGELNFSSISSWSWGNDAVKNDESMWSRSKPGNSEILNSAADIVMVSGSNYFTLDKGDSVTVAFAITLGNDLDDVITNIQNYQVIYMSGFNFDSLFQEAAFLAPDYHMEISNDFQINWNSINPNEYVDIYYSPDAGSTWEIIADSIPNTGSFIWNTNNVEDSPFAQLKIYIKNSERRTYAFSKSNYFTVNNSPNGKPYFQILNEDTLTSNIIADDNVKLMVLAGDPESGAIILNIDYSIYDSTEYFPVSSFNIAPDTMAQPVFINLNSLPNSPKLRLKFELTDGDLSYVYITSPFNKQNSRVVLAPQNLEVLSGNTEVYYEIRVVNSNGFKSDQYIISFDDYTDDEQKTFSVYNVYKNEFTIKDIPLIPFTESPLFDGLTFYNEDFVTSVDTLRTRWNNDINLEFNIMHDYTPTVRGYNSPKDYVLVFSNTFSDSSNTLSVPGIPSVTATNVNFKVFDISGDPQRIKFGYAIDRAPLGALSHGDLIFLSDSAGTVGNWFIKFEGFNSQIPGLGDTLFIYTNKGISIFDSLRLFNLPVKIDEEDIILNEYFLSQNYPNPFNPFTTIDFRIAHEEFVSLKIFNVLGQEVKTILSEWVAAGKHTITVDGGNLSSGVYFYQLKSVSFNSINKMVLLK